MQAPDQIADLLFKYLRNELTPEEQTQLESWRQESSKNEDIFNKLTDPDQLRLFLKDFHSRRNAWDKIVKLAPELKTPSPVRKLSWRPFTIAAAVILLIGLTIFIPNRISNSSTGSDNENVIAKEKKTDTLAGIRANSNPAILTLSDGRQIILDSTSRHTDVHTLGNNIGELSHGKLLYSSNDLSKTDTELFNILTIPRGGQIQLSLPDGTLVWLNAASMIKYPIAFQGKERKIEIKGEAYFEVTKNPKKPFIVILGDKRVEVLGTHFNINAYSDEPKTSVTLLEGSIRLQTSGQSNLLTPGEQALISNRSGKGNIELIKNADVTTITSWRTGTTRFKDADVQSIMRIVSRWYNLDVVYRGNIPERGITGGITKGQSLPELLKVLEWYKIHCTLSGNQITITP